VGSVFNHVFSAHPCLGIRVAQVRLILRLPTTYGIYQHPLAYVYWFKPLTSPVLDIGMYRISLSCQNLRQRASIIPITQILRSCHLIPVFGKGVPITWSSESVLRLANQFYLNPYLRHHDFVLLRYLVHKHEARQDRLRQAAVRRPRPDWSKIK
jgi:hypothetical protein